MSLQPGTVVQEEWFSPEECVQLSALWRACGPQAEAIVRETKGLLEKAYPSLAPELFAGDSTQIERELLADLRVAMTSDIGPLAARLTRFGALLARTYADLSLFFEVVEVVRRRLTHTLIEAYLREPVQLELALSGAHRLCDRTLRSISSQYVIFRDARMREARRSREAALQRFSRLSDSGVLGIIVCDYEGNIREANDTFLQMVGYSAEEVLSGQVRWSDMTPPEYAALDDEAIVQLRETGSTALWEKEYYRKDGSRIPILVSVSTLEADETTIAFVLDISEHKAAEELRARGVELEAENRRIQEGSRLKSEFLANMSHELRTPLNSIIGFADLLYDGEIDPSSPEYREFLGDILRSGRHLLQLINDVLDLAKIEAGKMDFRPEQVGLSRLVSEAADVLRSIALNNGVELSYDVAAEVEDVVIDPARLKQVLYNYLSNALKFTPAGGRVQIRALPAGSDHFRIEVEDTGIGIAPKDLDRLFAEFEQLDHGTTKRHGGTGLGLALTKRIVEAQGGTVGVSSVFGKGSVFTATLPRRTQPTQDANVGLIAERYDGAALILVVEDDARDRQALVRLLNGAGYSVEVAATGQEAIKACRERVFDAITLDLLLPDIHGLEVLRRVRREGLNQATPVVVLSMMKERGVVHGFSVHDFLQKPVDSLKLLESLSRAGVPPHQQGPILVVDDDYPSLRLMETTLRRLGYMVECHADGERALASAGVKQCQAVILDLLMPRVDGFEFLRRFRNLPEHRATPVIVWTIKDLTYEDHQRLRRSAQAVFEKGNGRPLPLIDELQALLRQRAGMLDAGT